MSRSTQERMRLSGMYAGAVSRLAAFALDTVIVAVTFSVLAAVAVYLVRLLSTVEVDPDRARGLWWTVGIAGWAFTYGFVSLVIAGRTMGKAIVGLRIVERDGSPLEVRAAFVRTVTMPLSFLVFGIGFVGLVMGRERRALHDVCAGTTVVYDWGDRPAELPGPLTHYLQRRQAVPGGHVPAADSGSGGVGVGGAST